jgi:hypothetical protein
MSGFENYAAEAASLELELVRKGIALGIDWDDATVVRQLAHDAIRCHPGGQGCDLHDPQQAARVELFGLAQLMLEVMRESAEQNIHTHGGPVWKAFSRALWAELSDAG